MHTDASGVWLGLALERAHEHQPHCLSPLRTFHLGGLLARPGLLPHRPRALGDTRFLLYSKPTGNFPQWPWELGHTTLRAAPPHATQENCLYKPTHSATLVEADVFVWLEFRR